MALLLLCERCAVASAVPDADLLLLVGQVLPAVEVVRLHARGRRAVKVLGAACRGEVAKVARVLRHLKTVQCKFFINCKRTRLSVMRRLQG